MDGTFVSELVEKLKKPVILSDAPEGPLTIVPRDWHRLRDMPPAARVQPLEVSTLAGVRDYATANIDSLPFKTGVMLHVEGATRVRMVEKLEDEAAHYRRNIPLIAAIEGCRFPFGQFMDAETFLIGLQTQFEKTPDREDLMTFVSSIRESSVRETKDDGFAQEVSTSRGVHVLQTARVPNPVFLKPFRTFLEVDQPESGFVLRLKPGGQGEEKPKLALFECDGGRWEVAAVESIAAWLTEHVPGVAVIR